MFPTSIFVGVFYKIDVSIITMIFTEILRLRFVSASWFQQAPQLRKMGRGEAPDSHHLPWNPSLGDWEVGEAREEVAGQPEGRLGRLVDVHTMKLWGY